MNYAAIEATKAVMVKRVMRAVWGKTYHPADHPWFRLAMKDNPQVAAECWQGLCEYTARLWEKSQENTPEGAKAESIYDIRCAAAVSLMAECDIVTNYDLGLYPLYTYKGRDYMNPYDLFAERAKYIM